MSSATFSTINKIDLLINNIRKEGIESVIKYHLYTKNIKIDENIICINLYIYHLKKYSKEIDNNLFIQDLRLGLPDFNKFSSLDLLNWIFNVKINEEKIKKSKANSNYFFRYIDTLQKEFSTEKIDELIIMILEKIKKNIIYKH